MADLVQEQLAGGGLRIKARHAGADTTLDVVGTATTPVWAAWAPTWYGITVGNAVIVARYVAHGKTVTIRASLIVGSTTVFSGTQVQLSLPLTSQASGKTSLPLRIYTTGTAQSGGWALVEAATGFDRAACYLPAGSWLGTGVSNGSHFDICGTYEAA